MDMRTALDTIRTIKKWSRILRPCCWHATDGRIKEGRRRRKKGRRKRRKKRKEEKKRRRRKTRRRRI